MAGMVTEEFSDFIEGAPSVTYGQDGKIPIVQLGVTHSIPLNTVTAGSLNGDVTGVFLATTVSRIQGQTVSGTTGHGSVVFSDTPALTGVPTAPTAAGGTNTDQIATTAFVAAMGSTGAAALAAEANARQAADTTLQTNINNEASARAAADALLAPIASPVFTGDPRAPTPPPSDNDTSVATTAFVKSVTPLPAAPTALAGDVAITGVATTFMRSDGAPAVQKTSSTAFGLAKVDGTTITASGGVLSVPPGAGITQLTGDVTAGPGSGSQAATLVTVNSNVGTFARATVTVDGKGRVTAASAGAADAGITQLTGDGTAGPGNGSQALTLATVNANVGTFQGLTVNGKGLVTAAANQNYITSAALPVGANPTATAGDVAVNGVATTFMRSDASPLIQKTSATVFGLAKVDGSTITAVGGVISAVTAGGGITQLTGDVTAGPGSASQVATLATVNANVGTWNNVTVNGKGLVTAGSNVSYLTQVPAYTGDVTSAAGGTVNTLATVNANVGTFQGLTINAKGLVTAAVDQAYATAANMTTADNLRVLKAGDNMTGNLRISNNGSLIVNDPGIPSPAVAANSVYGAHFSSAQLISFNAYFDNTATWRMRSTGFAHYFNGDPTSGMFTFNNSQVSTAAGVSPAITAQLYIDPAGNVGIGGTAGAKLEVIGSGSGAKAIVRGISPTGYNDLQVRNDINTNVRTCVLSYTGSTFGGVYWSGGVNGEQGAVGTTGNYPFSIGTNNTSRITVLNDGKVGIGTPTPGVKLEVLCASGTGQVGDQGVRFTDGAAQPRLLKIGINNASGNGYSYIQSTWEGNAHNTLALNQNGGYVGVGSAAPNTTFDVSGTSSAYAGAMTNGITFEHAAGTACGLLTGVNWTGTLGTSYSWLQSGQWFVAGMPIILNPGGGSVGINTGTAIPAYTLDIRGNLGVTSTSGQTLIRQICAAGTNNSVAIQGFKGGGGRWELSLCGGSAETGGNVGSQGVLSRFADDGAYISATLLFNRNDNSCLNATGTWGSFSDASIKKDIAPYDRGLDAVLALNPVSFRFNERAPFGGDEHVRFGLIADEVAPHLPEAVRMARHRRPDRDDEDELLTLDQGHVTLALINAMKTINARLEALEVGAT